VRIADGVVFSLGVRVYLSSLTFRLIFVIDLCCWSVHYSVVDIFIDNGLVIGFISLFKKNHQLFINIIILSNYR
jgi:hypothetical protein